MAAAFTHDGTGSSADEWGRRPEWAQAPALDLRDLDGDPLRTLVVVAAHPDDESLGAAGLMRTAAMTGLRVRLVLATAGERSHPRSPTLMVDELARVRRAESARALADVAPRATSRLLGIPDGEVAEHEDDLIVALVEEIGDGRGVLLVAPWSDDGHRDHDAAGRAASAAARRTSARCLLYPVWSWHWRSPGDLPWRRVRRLALAAQLQQIKRSAIRRHRSQVAPLSEHPGDDRLLTEAFLAHFDRPWETFIEDEPRDAALDRLHRELDDPWGVDHRWYEERKRSLLVAMLPRAHYRRAWEAGCSTGALAQRLSERAESVLATDTSEAALVSARRRADGAPWASRVTFERRDVSDDVAGDPAEFDLVVVSEVGYFLSPRDLERLISVVERRLARGGDLVLCHWRHEIRGYPLDGSDVHESFTARSGWATGARYDDDDVSIVVLTAHAPGLDGPDESAAAGARP